MPENASYGLVSHWDDVIEYFDRACELPAAERDDWLRRHCPDPVIHAEVLALLKADREASRLMAGDGKIGDLSPSAGFADDINATVSARGTRIGPYELDAPIGQGGMGQVYAAHRIDGAYDQQVAIKFTVLPPDASAHRNFKAECQNLARLDHPHIVGLLDAGIADNGVAYLVMPLIAGQTIDEWGRTKSFSPRERLQVFAQLCSAVAHAHRHLIVHRDIKPANVLVTDANQVKLLDFGISRDLNSEHTFTREAFSPRFAAPEQRAGQPVTTATDVYALGQLLRLLLVGQLPNDSAKPALMRPSVVAAEAGQRSLARQLKGDLDAIVTKCLAAEPIARYESAGALERDVLAWLDDRPLMVRPRTPARALVELLSRHKLAAITGGTTLALLLGAGSFHLHRVQQERTVALATTQFLVELVAEVNPYRRSKDDSLVVPLAELYEQGLAQLDSDNLPDEQRATLALAFASGLYSIGQYPQVIAAADNALGWSEPGSTAHRRALLQKANALTLSNQHTQALALHQQLQSMISEGLDSDYLLAAKISADYGAALIASGQPQDALQWLAEAERDLAERPLTEPLRAQRLEVLLNRSVALSRLGRSDEAWQVSDEHIRLAREWFGDDHIQTVRALGQAVTLTTRGSKQHELDMAKQAFEAARRVLGPDHSETITMHNNYALHLATFDATEAVAQFRLLIEQGQRRGNVNGDHYQNMASTLRGMNEHDQAEQAARTSLCSILGNVGRRSLATGYAANYFNRAGSDCRSTRSGRVVGTTGLGSFASFFRS